MTDDRQVVRTFETLSNTKQTPKQRQDNWAAIELRMDAHNSRSAMRQKNSGPWSLFGAGAAALCIVAAGFAVAIKSKSLEPIRTTSTVQPTATSLSLSDIVPSVVFNLQSFYPGVTGYASSDGNYLATWKSGSNGTATWIEDMSGHTWKAVNDKYFLVGSTPSGDVILSDVQPSGNPSATFPRLVYKPGSASASPIPKDPTSMQTRYATQSVTGDWATIESGSTNENDFIHTWVDLNGQVLPGLANAEYIAWSPDGSKLAAMVSVDETPKSVSAPWSVVQNEVVIYDLKTKKITRSAKLGMSGLSWSPDGQVIAVDCAETTSASTAGFYEFSSHDLKQIKEFPIMSRYWGWVDGHTALVSSGQAKTWNVTRVSWNIATGATDTRTIVSSDAVVTDMRNIGPNRCILHDSSGLWLLTSTGESQIVKKPVHAWWYSQKTHELYFVPDNTGLVYKVLLPD